MVVKRGAAARGARRAGGRRARVVHRTVGPMLLRLLLRGRGSGGGSKIIGGMRAGAGGGIGKGRRRGEVRVRAPRGGVRHVPAGAVR